MPSRNGNEVKVESSRVRISDFGFVGALPVPAPPSPSPSPPHVGEGILLREFLSQDTRVHPPKKGRGGDLRRKAGGAYAVRFQLNSGEISPILISL